MRGSGVEQVSFRDAEDFQMIRRVVGEMLAAPGQYDDLVRALLRPGILASKESAFDMRRFQSLYELSSRVLLKP